MAGFCNIRGCGGWTLVTVCFFDFVFLSLCPILPWMSNTPVVGYASERTWTLAYIKGFKTQSYGHVHDIACMAYGDLQRDTMLTCSIGLCRSYRDRCDGYCNWKFGAYGVLGLTCCSAFASFIGLFLACRGTTQAYKAMGCMLFFIVSAESGGLFLWYDNSDYALDKFNEMSLYPLPVYGFGMFVCAFSALLALFASFLCCIQYNKARREELGITSEDEYDSEGSD